MKFKESQKLEMALRNVLSSPRLESLLASAPESPVGNKSLKRNTSDLTKPCNSNRTDRKNAGS